MLVEYSRLQLQLNPKVHELKSC